jgi:hypothetical protein
VSQFDQQYLAPCRRRPLTRHACTRPLQHPDEIDISTLYRQLRAGAQCSSTVGTPRAVEVIERGNRLNHEPKLFDPFTDFRRTAMQALIIKDLETSKELTGKELSAVRGGFNAALLGGQAVLGGFGIGNTTVALNTPIVTQVEVTPVTIVDLNLANVIGSLGTAVGQA